MVFQLLDWLHPYFWEDPLREKFDVKFLEKLTSFEGNKKNETKKRRKKKKNVDCIGKPRGEARAFEMEQPPPNVEVDTLGVATIQDS